MLAVRVTLSLQPDRTYELVFYSPTIEHLLLQAAGLKRPALNIGRSRPIRIDAMREIAVSQVRNLAVASASSTSTKSPK